MKKWIRKALTRTLKVQSSSGPLREIEDEPSEALVYGVAFATASLIALTTLQLAHMAFMGRWSNEIFAAITGLIGTIIGVFFGKKG